MTAAPAFETPRHECATPGPALAVAARFQALVPVLETERVTLRAPRLSDFTDYAEIVCTERGRHIGGPFSREEAWFAFSGAASGWMFHGHGAWTVEETATGAVLGFVALGLEPGDREVELGYLMTEAGEGRGLAAEAARAVRDWAARELHLTGLVSYVDPGNARSARLAERLGAARDATAEAAFGEPIHVYRHTAPETRQ